MSAKLSAPPYSRAGAVVQGRIRAVDGNLQEEHGRPDQSVGDGGDPGAIGGNGTGHPQGGGVFDQIHRPLVEHGLTAPEVEEGPVAMGHQVIQDLPVAFRGDLVLFKLPEIFAVQKSLVAPLAAGMAAQVADVGDPEAQLADLPGPPGIQPGGRAG